MDEFEDLSDLPIEILRSLPRSRAYGEGRTAKIIAILKKHSDGLRPWQIKVAYWREHKVEVPSSVISSILGTLLRRGKIGRNQDGGYFIVDAG